MTSCNFLPQHYVNVILTNQSLLDHIVLPIEKKKVDLDLAEYFSIILWKTVRSLVVIKYLGSPGWWELLWNMPDEGLGHVYSIHQTIILQFFTMKNVPFQNTLQRYQYYLDLQDFLISNSLFYSNYVFVFKWGCFHNKILWYCKMAKIFLHSTDFSVWSALLHHGPWMSKWLLVITKDSCK